MYYWSHFFSGKVLYCLANQVSSKIVFFRKVSFLLIFSSYTDVNFPRSIIFFNFYFANFNSSVISVIASCFCGIDMQIVTLLLKPLVLDNICPDFGWLYYLRKCCKWTDESLKLKQFFKWCNTMFDAIYNIDYTPCNF